MRMRSLDRIVGLFTVLVAVASPATAAALPAGGWVGSRVITQFGTVLKVGGQVVDDEERQASAQSGERNVFRVYRV
jgi:hypothetical protein